MLDKEFNYYLSHQNELVAKYNNRFIVIKGEKVIGDYATTKEAYTEASKTEQPGTFLIQLCSPGTSSHTQTFHSQVMLHA